MIVSLVLVALLVCGLGVYGVARLGDATANSPTASGNGTSGSTKADPTTLTGVLQEQSKAMLSGDANGFLATVDSAAPLAIAAYQRCSTTCVRCT